MTALRRGHRPASDPDAALLPVLAIIRQKFFGGRSQAGIFFLHEKLSRDLLHQAQAAGVSVNCLWQLSVAATSWRSWRLAVEAAIEELSERRGQRE